jgi:hypothetical protein
MLPRNYDRVQRYFPMRAIGLAVAERGLRAYFRLCPDGMVTKAGIPKNPSPRLIADSTSCLTIFYIGLMGR